MRRELPIHDRRDDVQGLRAVAVALVVAYHLWPSGISGGFVGVDVFFVISGFLITRNLLASPPRGRGDVIAFWERRIRRLLPAAFFVLVVTLFATHFLAPATDWVRTAKEAIASALYVENWYLVQQATDYLAPTEDPTPVQHYWSLAVEEQFYLVWPILMIGTAIVAGNRIQPRTLARFVIGAVLLISLAYSVMATANDPAASYFMTTTRIWELAAGGLLATWIAPVKLPWLRMVLAWGGLAVIGASALLYSSQTPWPGYHALLPVIGAVMFIGAASGAQYGPGIVLGSRAAQWTGDASYSIYLWHWPLVTLAPLALNRDLNVSDQMVVLAMTLALSWVTFEYIENRWRFPDPRTSRTRPFQLAAAGALGVALVAGTQVLGVHLSERAVAATAGKVETDKCFGAAALARGTSECPTAIDAEVTPSPTEAQSDRAAPFDNGCMARPPYDDARTCRVGTGSVDVALVGNSHAAHWLPALEDIAADQNLTITTYLVTACTTIDAPLDYANDDRVEGCENWRDRTLEATKGDQYDLVITSQRSVHPVQGYSRDETYQPWVDGMRSFLTQWSDAGTPVMVIRDTPYPGDNVPECVAQNLFDQSVCSGLRDVREHRDPLVEASTGLDGISVVDLNDYFCRGDKCNDVIGGVVAYFDGSHLSATFARSMAPYLATEISVALAEHRSDVSVASGGR